MKAPRHTAILIFSRTAAEEAAVKTFDRHLGRNAARAVAQRLIRRATATARQAGLPVFTCFSPQQSGHRFGERLANAIEAVYAKGFEKVIAIGNDCPDLHPGLLRQAAEDLESTGLVMGPAHDGGVYLLGMAQDAYDRQRFLALPWQTEQLLSGWHDYAAQAQVAIGRLEGHRDIDHSTDFHDHLHSGSPADPLIKALRAILDAGLPHPPQHPPLRRGRSGHSAVGLRAPPF